ncbi:MAG: hypothetical protein P8I84_07390 [Paracoccaceae bacterium]|nr:hypothetical protein [Paracoccaceae bacterium]
MYNEPDSKKLTMIFATIRRSLIWIGLMLSISILVFLIIWGVSLNVSENAEIPVVKAKIKEARIISENPGGQIINYQGLSVNNVQEQGAAQVTAKRILLAPEPVELRENDLTTTAIKKTDNLDDLGNAVINQSKKTIVLNETEEDDQEDKQLMDDPNKVSALALKRSRKPWAREMLIIQNIEKVLEIAEVEISDEEIVEEEITEPKIKRGTNLVQLGSYPTRKEAQEAWASFLKRNGTIFKNKKRSIQKFDSSRYPFQLRALGFTTSGDSRDFCILLTGLVPTCLPMRAK